MEDLKLQRFLKKIELKNIDRFDMSFDVAKWSPLQSDLFVMVIRKETPWVYPLLADFLEALKNVKFYYELKLVYDMPIKEEDVMRLFSEWYIDKHMVPCFYDYSFNEQEMHFVLPQNAEEDFKEELNNFQNILKRINYDYKVSYELQNQEPSLEEIDSIEEDDDFSSLEEEIENINEEEKEENIEGEMTTSYSYEQRVEDERVLLDVLKQNRLAAAKERKSFNGGYKHVRIKDIHSNIGNVDIDCVIYELESKLTKKGTMMYLLGVGDKEFDAISVKLFEGGKSLPKEKLDSLKVGMNIRLRGQVNYDTFKNELTIIGRFVDIMPKEEDRVDTSSKKRVELHLHTKMSTMDGTATIEDYVKLAKSMGHKAIAITDHGVVQGYPLAQKVAKDNDIKMLYGCELYMIDDKLNPIMNPSPISLEKATYVVFDFETTGLSARYDEIIEFGACKVVQGMKRESMDLLINPMRKLSPKIEELTGITNKMLANKPTLKDVFKKIRDFIGDSILVSHNAEFDVGFLNEAAKKLNEPLFTNPVVDTLALSRYLFPEARNHRLGSLCRHLDVEYDEISAHRADYDAEVLNNVWQAIIAQLNKEIPNITHEQLLELKLSEEHLKHLRPKHVIAFAKNPQGLKDLFKLVSFGHIKYFADVPKIPRSILQEYRKNLLLGSACFNGEVFDSARTKSREYLKSVVSFYDYIELQPPENYSYLINMGDIANEDELKKYMLDIIDVANEENKMVVATGDCHYLNPQDKMYRDIFIYAKGIGNVNHPLHPYSRDNMEYFENPDQHFRSTDEMLEAFAFLGEEKAEEIVITNTNLIADQLEELKPIKEKLYTPTIENCAELLSEKCYNTAKAMYGDPLPEIVKNRLEAELKGIIEHGYSVIYYIAMKLVNRANDDGYIVGSRGSVGSSFVATMAGITEVNALPPHYRCPHCLHSEFLKDSPVSCGFDLPEKKCPECGEDMIHDGQDIPFATFLGFNADKVPDIDLNFPPDYQQFAHGLTKELLGAGNVFKAGTIETVADKTAYGYVKGYFERVGEKLGIDPLKVSPRKIDFISKGCVDIKRTTGQHPGGIVVIPGEFEVYDFTPIQYPADDKEATWRTTHFDFHAIHDNVLKLDLLGHVDPLALKQMADSIDIDYHKLPLNDEKVLSLFSTDVALNRHSNYLGETTGALGLPEFGTNFVRGMLKEAKPKTFSDLLIISGLSHGTDVWNGNAQDLIRDGICTLQEVIGCRDDIMVYLSKMGVPPSIAFKIMEDVRKGKKVKPEYEEIMRANNVPDYYIDSCNKIKYMFPKAHAAAYVMMAIRVGWFKVYRPLTFYATFFSVRCKQFDLETMLKGEQGIIAKLEELKEHKLSDKEKELEKTLIIALEMAERGYKFSNINLYKSNATNFIVDEDTQTIIPPFTAIDGLGENAAMSIIEAREDGKFLSKENLFKRTKLNNTNIEKLSDFHALDGLDETDQMNLFSFFDSSN